MAKSKVSQKSLPFVSEDLARRLSDQAHRRAVEILQQMLIQAVLADHHSRETSHERKDSADAS
jgi:hypothetical protein